MPWKTGGNGEQEYRPDPEEASPNWCFMHDAEWPMCEEENNAGGAEPQ